ncbi:hypothetical protein KP509_14G027600 [Ceratopteris richardii]|uniref:Myeloid leukemia factor n=2 Tax=Ceratopteris richardii TaxID=49495 RepID=A0A8T2T8V0_CERRI|nr:hypothetical protein KP509_14G027600 [Ceratopteris richardii]
MNSNDAARAQGRRRPRSGFADFGSDPFFGGMMGSSSFFDDFFNRDPFNDPFFNRPMGMGLLGGGGLFGRMNPFGMGMSSLFDRSEFFTRPDGSFLDQQPYQQPAQIAQPLSRRGPIIEELTEDTEETDNGRAQNKEHPIVEHPEDDEEAGQMLQHRDVPPQARCLQAFNDRYPQRSSNMQQSNRSYQNYSFQSSSMSFGGSGGSFYSSSSMRRVGPDGIVQEEHVERDSSGKESRTSARGLRDQIHAVTKRRNTVSGPETTVETLRNLEPEEVPHFDARWEAQAQRNLQGWNRGRAQALEGHHQGSRRQAAPALQYHDEGSQQRMTWR